MAYLFSPEKIHAIGRLGAGLPHEEMCRAVIDALDAEYPGHIQTKQDWVFNLAAGATGMMTILHASLTEYLIIFGTPIGTEAFSGRYLLDIYDVVMAGEMWTYTEDRWAERVVTRPGEMAYLRRGGAKGYRLPEGGWMLEYGRGLVPTALPVGLMDSIMSGIDPVTVLRTLRGYGAGVVRELLKGKI